MGAAADSAHVIAFCAARGIDLAAEQVGALLAYADLLEKWNRSVNLVSYQNRRELLDRHILDALSMVGYLEGSTVIDAGSGAGLPGIPLAIARPEIRFHLVDSIAKKTAFLLCATSELQLGNVMIHCSRLHALEGTLVADCLVARAFGPLPELLQESRPVLSAGATLLLMKGRSHQAELERIRPPFRKVAIHDLSAGETPGQSVLLQLVMDGPQ